MLAPVRPEPFGTPRRRAVFAVGVAFYLASDLGASAQDALFVGFYRRYAVRPTVVRFVLADTPLPAALQRPAGPAEVLAEVAARPGG